MWLVLIAELPPGGGYCIVCVFLFAAVPLLAHFTQSPHHPLTHKLSFVLMDELYLVRGRSVVDSRRGT